MIVSINQLYKCFALLNVKQAEGDGSISHVEGSINRRSSTRCEFGNAPTAQQQRRRQPALWCYTELVNWQLRLKATGLWSTEFGHRHNFSWNNSSIAPGSIPVPVHQLSADTTKLSRRLYHRLHKQTTEGMARYISAPADTNYSFLARSKVTDTTGHPLSPTVWPGVNFLTARRLHLLSHTVVARVRQATVDLCFCFQVDERRHLFRAAAKNGACRVFVLHASIWVCGSDFRCWLESPIASRRFAVVGYRVHNRNWQ